MLDVLFVSDYVCPYCLVAKAALRQALRETGKEAKITWQPYELTEEPKERVDTYHDENRRAHYQVLVEPVKELGLNMKLPPNVVPRPYTRLAFEGWYFACDKGRGDEYNDAVYNAYFIDEKDISDIEVLMELAKGVGLDREEFRCALETGKYTVREKEAVAFAKNTLKVRGVPTVYINGEKVHLTSYTTAEMKRIISSESKESIDEAGAYCSIDGCKF